MCFRERGGRPQIAMRARIKLVRGNVAVRCSRMAHARTNRAAVVCPRGELGEKQMRSEGD